MDAGLAALLIAERKYAQALVRLTAIPGGGLMRLPHPYPLHERHPLWLRQRVGDRREQEWRTLRRELIAADALPHRVHTLIKAGLTAAVEAYNWLDDIVQDLPGETVVDVETFDVELTGMFLLADLLAAAHQLVHSLGELLGGLFGCEYSLEGDGYWYDSCAVRIMHLRYGLSMGFTTRYVCTVCGLDAGECSHVPGTSYDLADEQGGERTQVVASYVMTDGVMHETTLTPRPRDPLARLKSVSVDFDGSFELAGGSPKACDTITDARCLYPCGGFNGDDLADILPALA